MLINLLFVLKQKIDDIHKQKYLKHKSLNVAFPCRLSNTNNARSAWYWVYEAPLSNDSLDMDKKEKIIISPEADRHHKPKINKPLIAVLILGTPTKDRREHLKYGNRIHLESEHNDKMTLFQIVPYIRVLFLSICWGTVGGAYFPNFGK